MADFRKHFTATSQDDFRRVADQLRDAGSVWGRLTNLPEVGIDAYCMEGWEERPEDDGPLPTALSPDCGLDETGA